MVDHNGVLMMQRLLLAGALGLSMARKAAAILEGDPDSGTWPPQAPPLPPVTGPEAVSYTHLTLPTTERV